MKTSSDIRLNHLMKEVACESRVLPAESYTSAAYTKREMKVIFEQSWVAVGFASEVLNPGDSLPREILGKPILITRDENNVLHVFANVCRHRGHILVEQPCNGKKSLTCPYHAWSYALDGRFLNAPFWDGNLGSAPDAGLKNRLSLIAIPFAVWYDIIFINLTNQGKSFEQTVKPLNDRWADVRPASLLRRFDSKYYSIPGNWKLVAENFLDNYHLPWVHPEVGSSIEANLGLDTENIALSQEIIGFSHPTAGKDKSKMQKPLPMWPDVDSVQSMVQDLFYIFPNTCLVMEGNYLWSMILLPDGAEQCNEVLSLYVLGDDAMGEDFKQSRKQLADTIYKINDQDAVAIKRLQQGRHSDAASEGIFNDRHDQLAKWFHQRVAHLMLASES